jgi:hypothetical protein
MRLVGDTAARLRVRVQTSVVVGVPNHARSRFGVYPADPAVSDEVCIDTTAKASPAPLRISSASTMVSDRLLETSVSHPDAR